MTTPDSARKSELLASAYQYALANGLAEYSLRPLAAAIGTSPRVLLFLFGSKDGLTRALLARAREGELAAIAAFRSAQGGTGLAATARAVWSWLIDPSHRGLLTLWLEGYARSLLSEPGPWASFAQETVADWLELLSDSQPAARRHSGPGQDERTLLLAVLRGALLDVLATGDVERASRAVEYHLGTLRA